MKQYKIRKDKNNQLFVTLPILLADQISLKAGDSVEIRIQGNSLLLTPIKA